MNSIYIYILFSGNTGARAVLFYATNEIHREMNLYKYLAKYLSIDSPDQQFRVGKYRYTNTQCITSSYQTKCNIYQIETN